MTTLYAHGRAAEHEQHAQPLSVVCAWCKARERRGDTWGPLSSEQCTAYVSHGICPDCFARELKKLKRRW